MCRRPTSTRPVHVLPTRKKVLSKVKRRGVSQLHYPAVRRPGSKTCVWVEFRVQVWDTVTLPFPIPQQHWIPFHRETTTVPFIPTAAWAGRHFLPQGNFPPIHGEGGFVGRRALLPRRTKQTPISGHNMVGATGWRVPQLQGPPFTNVVKSSCRSILSKPSQKASLMRWTNGNFGSQSWNCGLFFGGGALRFPWSQSWIST